jgi:hypothetical protein
LVRRSFYGVLFVGFATGVIVTEAMADSSRLDLDTSSGGKVIDGLLTPFALVFVALVLRLATRWIGIVLAYPLAREYQGNVGPRGASGVLDRALVARALRTLRWSYQVRLVAIDRLGDTGARFARIDHLVGVINVVAGVCSVIALFAFGATITV